MIFLISFKTVTEKFLNKVEDNRILQAIRNGMVLAIPMIMAGSFALLLSSIPISRYQTFINTALNGVIGDVFSVVNSSTLGIISLILLLTISYSYEQLTEFKGKFILPLVSLCSYFVFSRNGDGGLASDMFTSTWLFSSILVTVVSCVMFVYLSKHQFIKAKTYADGTDSNFNMMLANIFPFFAVMAFFAILNVVLTSILGVPNFQTVFSDYIYDVLSRGGRSLASGMSFVFLLHFMWFFGIHGGNVLDGVAHEVFGTGTAVNMGLVQMGLPPTEIVTKTFLDTFALFGGCGTLLCLVVAIFLFEKRKNVRELSKLATFPVLFNINELMLFGVPIVLNPIYMIPFLCTPLVLTLVSYLAMASGLVPYAVNTVEWTSPIFLSGYAATGSIAGSILQFVNLVIGVLIYVPFVKLSQRRYLVTMKARIESLTQIVKDSENDGKPANLLDRRDALGSMAKTLVADMQHALKSSEIDLFYQPQVRLDGTCMGAEALLRWNHPIGGYLYPPLVISLAQEAGLLDQLGMYIADRACEDIRSLKKISQRPFNISINLTACQVDSSSFTTQLSKLIAQYEFEPGTIGIEITEQTALSSSGSVVDRLSTFQDLGVYLIMDDFGMGHSSLVYLQNNKFNMVKLDGSLVRDITTNDRCKDIISSIIYLSGSLGFQVLAEFVETVEQRDALAALGCVYYQGYLYSKAVPFDQFVDFFVKSTTSSDTN